jgi:hypothetical protein
MEIRCSASRAGAAPPVAALLEKEGENHVRDSSVKPYDDIRDDGAQMGSQKIRSFR